MTKSPKSFDQEPKCSTCRCDLISCEVTVLYDGVAYWYCAVCDQCYSRKGTPLTKDQVIKMTREDVFNL